MAHGTWHMAGAFKMNRKAIAAERVVQALIDTIWAHEIWASDGSSEAISDGSLALACTSTLNLLSTGIGVTGVKYAESAIGLGCKHLLAERGAFEAVIQAMRRTAPSGDAISRTAPSGDAISPSGVSAERHAEQQRLGLNAIASLCFGHDGKAGFGSALEATCRRDRAAEAGALAVIVEVMRAQLALD